MPIVYCQLFAGEKLLADRLLVSIEREAGPREKAARGGTFRVPTDHLTTVRADQTLRLEFPEKVARRLQITEGNSVHIIAHKIHDRIAHFDEVLPQGSSPAAGAPLGSSLVGACWNEAGIPA